LKSLKVYQILKNHSKIVKWNKKQDHKANCNGGYFNALTSHMQMPKIQTVGVGLEFQHIDEKTSHMHMP
jgi:hypothetical protein